MEAQEVLAPVEVEVQALVEEEGLALVQEEVGGCNVLL